MKRPTKLWTNLPAARIYPSAPRFYSTENGNVRATTLKRLDEVESTASATDEPDLEGLFKFGETLSGIDPQNKTLKTAVGSLPISPLLDPTWRKARETRKKKKPIQFKKMNRFQQRTQQNPYAQLLAEPVRNCHVTRARLPKPFLQSFGIVAHPETGDLWWMPAGFEEPTKGAAMETPDDTEAQSADEDEAVPSNEPVTDAEANISPDKVADSAAAGNAITTAKGQENPSTKQNSRFWAPAHVLARQDLLMEFWKRQSKYSGGYFRFAMLPSVGKLAGKASWRQDMHEVLRERMRREIVDNFIDVSKMCQNGDRDYVVKIDTPQDSLRLQNRNCFLRLSGEYHPFDYLEVPDMPGTARPVYHLPELLGAEQWQRLKSASPLFDDASPLREASLLVLKGKANIKLNKKLWRLQGFLAD